MTERERLRAILDHSALFAGLLDLDGSVLEVNRAALEFTRSKREDVIERHFWALPWWKSPDAEARMRAAVESAARGQTIRFQQVFERADGALTTLEFSIKPVHDEAGRVVALLPEGRDISEQCQVERALRESRAQLAAILGSIEGIVWEAQADGSSPNSFVSVQAERLLGYPIRAWQSEAGFWEAHLHEDDRERTLAAFAQALVAGQPFRAEYRMIAADGRVVWFTDVVSVTHDDHGRPSRLRGVMIDITNRKRTEAQLEHQASHDALTDLPNRATFTTRLEDALERTRTERQPLAVAFLDLDGFKVVNDTLGHAAGDALLKETARRLRACLRSGDTLARMGGDEFTVLLPGVRTREDAALVGQKLLEALSPAFRLGAQDVQVSASVGLCLSSCNDDAETLLRAADAAMYRAKASGKGCGHVCASSEENPEGAA